MNILYKFGNSVKIFILKYLIFKPLQQTLLLAFFFIICGCIKQFIPEVSEDQDILVVEGLITDQPGQNEIKVSTSMPLGISSSANPVTGCTATITDNLGNIYNLQERDSGTYVADPSFQGVIGRSYTLHLKASSSYHNQTYESSAVLMNPVPPIDSLYYERLVLKRGDDGFPTGEGCQIYISTHDPGNMCKYYRWEFAETWEIRLPYIVPNKVCWVTNKEGKINIKNMSSYSENIINHLPINYVSNETDRLKVRYSILVNQYSMNEDEFTYWDKLQSIVQQVGSLYDKIPASTPGNIRCIEKPSETVLGYFSASAVSSRRIFVNGYFRGMPDLYSDCENASVSYFDSIPGLNHGVWVIIDEPQPYPGFRILTFTKGCADCTVRGTNIQPDYWYEGK
jgi:hypothetical protein